MAIQRKKTPRHSLVVDTNILWHQEKSESVSPDFEKFWQDYSERFSIKLAIPAVVRDELLYQQTTSALKSLNRANEALERTGHIASTRYTHRVTEERVRRDVSAKIEKWRLSRGGILIPTPIQSIEWEKVVEAAVWRQPPFAEDPKNPDFEKGFRDALILESVVHFATQASNRDQIAFASADAVLRNAVEKRAVSVGSFSVFESLEEFSAYLRLTEETLTEEFVHAIRRKASTKFFTPADQSSLYFRSHVGERIQAEFASEFQQVEPTYTGLTATYVDSLASLWSWEPVPPARVYVSQPIFDRLEHEHDFYWRSRVTFAQVFKYVSSIQVASLGFVNAKMRVLEFGVTWKSRVKADGRFHDMEVVGIVLESRRFDPPADEELRHYRLALPTPSAGAVG